MTVDDDLKLLLTGSPYPLPVQGRVYSHKAPQNATQPYLVFYRIAVTPRHSQIAHVRMLERLFQLSIFGASQSAVLAAADTLRRYLDGFSGVVGGSDFQGILWQNERMLFNDASGLHQAACDYSVRYREL